LKEAQDKGFAEADPTADVGGADAAAKIRLVSLLGFGEEITLDDIPRDSIENFVPPNEIKGAIKRISTVWKHETGFDAILTVKDLSLNNFIAQAAGEEAHAIFYFDDGDVYKIRGKGAGRWPTTESVMADLYDIFVLSLIAEKDGTVIGQITFSPVTIDGVHDDWFGLGPVSVTPEFQSQGIGGALIKAGLAELQNRNANGCVLVGNPDYYSRFDFFSDPDLGYGGFENKFVQQHPICGPAKTGQIKYCHAFESPES